MVIGQGLSRIEIIALDFYDGVTEGFALSLGNFGASYFKLIAWDDKQDQRLFVAVPTNKTVFKKMSELLSDSQPASRIWLTDWVFRSAEDELEANKIVASCLADLKSKGILILGNQIDGEEVRVFNIAHSLLGSVEKALQEPEDLDSWLVMLKDE